MSELEHQDTPPPDLQGASTGTNFTDEEVDVTATTSYSKKKKVTISTVYDAPDDPNISALGASAATAVTLDSNIISNRDQTHRRGQSGDSGMIEKTEHINRRHVQNVFRGSTTVGYVNMEQIERIRMMHDKISEGAEWNFNYCCLLIISSIVAGLGLMSDSSTTVISSMLLSPIMGPVIGMSYGLVIWDIRLIKKSAVVELASIVICIFFGCILAVACSWTEMAEDWATGEMLSRGTRQTFLVGVPIAFFSGLGVALSVLDDSTSSLVGVAISASLLPPAVNCGILLLFAGQVKVNRRQVEFANEDEDFVTMGIMSLALTAANIFVVWLAAALMFRLKEVLPVKKKVFWDDLKHARRIYQRRAVLEDEGGGNFSVRNLRAASSPRPASDVVAGAVES